MKGKVGALSLACQASEEGRKTMPSDCLTWQVRHMVGFWGCSMQGQELDWRILMGLFQLRGFWDSVSTCVHVL